MRLLLKGLHARVSFLSTSTAVVRRLRSTGCVVACLLLLASGSMTLAQETGSGQIEGTVTDPSGAAILKAKVTATNVTTGVELSFETNKTGAYLLTPLKPDEYTLTVEAPGFEKHVQEHIIIDGLQTLRLSVKMVVGSDQQVVTVSEAPPALETADASLGGTIENEMYANLPLSMGGAPRDPTAFQFLMPGVQEGTGRGVFAGSGQENLNEVYLDGVPMTNATAQGSGTPISSAVSVDAVDQFQVKTNGGGVALGGIGVTNYTLKSGTNKFHGTVFDYVRNTMFDTWGYFAKVPAANGYATKPGEHQNSYGVALGGPILRDRFFFFGTYEGFHYTKISNTPQYITVPTLRERTGDFTEIYGTAVAGLFDPTQATATLRGVAFQGLLNGVPTNNVIPQNELSSISTYFQKALPAPTNGGTVNNYLAGLPLENEDYRIDIHLDYNINPRNQLSITGVGGTNGYGNKPNYSTQQQLPEPYAVGTYTNARTSSGVITYTFVASQATINTVKYGFSRTWGPGFAPSANGPFTATAAGIQNTPPGNASNAIPNLTFGYNAQTSPLNPYSWGGSGDTGGGGTNTFTIIDNFTVVRGRHNIVAGFQYQWLEANGNTYGTYSNTLENDFNGDDTECISTTCPTLPSGITSGFSYASYLVGAVYRSRIEDQSITTIGGRYKPFAPYISDNWRATAKLTLDLGLRWDYLQPYHEVLDRIAFLNPNVINPAIGIPGGLSYAGYGPGPNPQYSPYICQCSTPVNSHDSNFEPRVGVTYTLTNNFVLRGGFGIMTTHAGGVGGRAGATVGTGTSEYSATTVWAQTGSTGEPAFFLNPGLTGDHTAQYTPGMNSQANYSSIPNGTVPGASLNPLGAAGNYTLSGPNTYGCTLGGDNVSCLAEPLNYADPNYGGRGPQFMNWNFGFQRMIDKAAVLSINYAGSQTHFLAGGGNRGYATNSVSPDYLVPLGANLGALATSAGTFAAVQTAIPGFRLPFSNFGGQSATVLKALSPFPQFLNNTDLWGQTGNSNYNSLQISIIQRPWHRLSGLFNYTFSKEIDDTHGHRTEYPVGPQDGNFNKFYPSDRVDRGVGTFNQPNVINATWVYQLPFGEGAIGASHFLVRAIAGGWGLSGIYKYRPGVPLQVTNSYGCNSATTGGQGTCLPDYAPGMGKSTARVNGKWGHGPGANASNVQQIQYLNPASFQCIDNTACSTLSTTTGSFKLGNIAKAAPLGLIGPGYWDIDMGIRRTFQVRETPSFNLKLQVEADVINTTNSTFFSLGNGGAAWGSCAVGTTPSTCAAKAYGTVGGQNPSVPPRDWQFAGRFIF